MGKLPTVTAGAPAKTLCWLNLPDRSTFNTSCCPDHSGRYILRNTRNKPSEIPGNGCPWFLWPGNAFASQTMAIVKDFCISKTNPHLHPRQPHEKVSYHNKGLFSPSSLSVEKKQIRSHMLRPEKNNHGRQRPDVCPSLRNAPTVSDGKENAASMRLEKTFRFASS